MVSSAITIPTAIICFFILDAVDPLVPYLLAISAASFIYIALSDLAPTLHQKIGWKYYLRQLVLILAGVIVMTLILMLGGHAH